MPTYQYACTECDHAFEQVQSFSDDALTDCPRCTGRLRKLFNAVGVVFKGSGFYRTDSRSSSTGSDPAGASDKPAGPSEKSPGGSSEKKADKRSDTKSGSTAAASTSGSSAG